MIKKKAASQCITKHKVVCLSIIVILISIFKVKLSARVNAEILKLKRVELRLQTLENHPLLCPPSVSLPFPSQLC